jgi:integrase
MTDPLFPPATKLAARRFPRRDLYPLIKDDRVIWDQTLPGFGLRFHASGRRTWIVFTRIRGVVSKIHLGNAAVVTEAEARGKAQLLILEAKVRRDPLARRKQARATPQFHEFCATYWRRWAVKWKPRTIKANNVYRDSQLLPAFGKLFLDQIDEEVVLAWFVKYTETSPGGANRTLSMLSHMFRKAEDWGVLPPHSNPCPAIKHNPRRIYNRYLSEAELKRVGVTLDKLEAEKPLHVGAIRMFLYTGCRRNEIMSLRWEDVVGRYMQLYDSKTGPRQVDLAEAAQEALRRIPRLRGNPWVFPARCKKDGHTKSVINFWRKDVLAPNGIPPLRLHDIRHTFASHAALESENTPMIAKLLGHSMVRTSERYMHLGDKPAIEAAEVVSGFLAAALAGKPIPFANEGRPFTR